MSPPMLLLSLIFGVISAAAAGEAYIPDATTAFASTANTTTLSAYQVLHSYNLPVGLLPQGALGYDLDPSTGKFAAYLNGSCSFALEGSYQLRYKSTVTGYISKNHLKQLQGVSVKVLLFWVNIIEVSRVGDDLEFSVGIASADFPISNFDVCPKCGCGVDCVTLRSGDGVRADSSVKLRVASF